MTMQAGNWGPILSNMLRDVFETTVNRPRPMLETLYNVTTSDKYQERYLGVGANGLVRPFQGTLAYETFDAGYESILKNHELVEKFAFASSEQGGNGATIAEIKV